MSPATEHTSAAAQPAVPRPGSRVELVDLRRSFGSTVDVLIRPESLRLAPADHGAGIVTTRTFLGQLTRVAVRLGGDAPVLVDQPSDVAATLDPGASVDVALAGRGEVMVTSHR